jgi:3-hydroxyisobutyrate dehydrogenase-like beta-hydroxyacid dehydrogenase
MAATVAVIGLGAMGFPVARHLLAAGVGVSVRDLDPRTARRAGELGARIADTPGDAARDAAAVAVFVPTDQDVLDVCTGADGVLANTRDSAVVMLCSSLRPDTCAAVAAGAPRGVDVLDTALTGGVRGAEAGEINLLVGGDRAALDRIRSLLDPWTSAVHHLGPLGSGQIGKTANNLVHWAQICAITEALELARRAGVDVPALRQALMSGPTDSRTLRELQHMRLTWHAKDLANTTALAREVGLPVPVTETAQRIMRDISVADVARLLAGGPLWDDEAQRDGGNVPVTLPAKG